MLGIRVQPVVNRGHNGRGVGGTTTSDITGGISSLYVYTDILEPVAVGDTEAQLLRVVDVKGRNGETVHKTFDHLHYVPIQKKRFDTIEVDIRDDTGAPISFETGRLIATLHIRRASHPYFSS
jgi:CBS domain-containing protein